MKSYSSLLLVASACLGPLSTSQSQTPLTPINGYEILERVAQRYANASSYHIRATNEYVTWNKFQRNWEKKIWDAAEGPGNKFRYEGESGYGHGIRVSDGKEVWNFHVEESAYTKTSSSRSDVAPHGLRPLIEIAVSEASGLRSGLASMGKMYKSATRLPDAEIEIDGKHISCYLVQLKSSDERRKRADELAESTLWIDKVKDIVVKESRTASAGGPIHFESENTTTYLLTELDSAPPDSLFSFNPPAEAKLLERFPDNFTMGGSLEGRPLPAIKITTAGGKQFSTDSLRGKPALLDLWASWCEPCVQELDFLAAVYPRVKDKLAVITIDQNEEAKDATDLIARKKYTWPNVHDDGDIAGALGGIAGFPRTILVDSDGKVIYDKTGYDEEDLHRAISSLGAEYAALFANAVPCKTGAIAK